MEAVKNSNEIKVADWMTETVLAVEIYDSISVARQLMAKHRVNQLPVLDHDRLMGIVTDRDIRDAYPTSMLIGRTKEIDKFAESYTVEEVMTHDVFTVRTRNAVSHRSGVVAPSPYRLAAGGQRKAAGGNNHAQRYFGLCFERGRDQGLRRAQKGAQEIASGKKG